MTCGDLARVIKIVEGEVDIRECRHLLRVSQRSSSSECQSPLLLLEILVWQLTVSPAVCTVTRIILPTSSCAVLTNDSAQNEILCKADRCYVCLRQHHLSKDYRSTVSCKIVEGDITLSYVPGSGLKAVQACLCHRGHLLNPLKKPLNLRGPPMHCV